MPQPYHNASANRESASRDSSQISSICPSPLTPPPEELQQRGSARVQDERRSRLRSAPSPDNTAAGMAQSQEDSIYLSPATSAEDLEDGLTHGDNDKMDTAHEDYKDGTKTPMVVNSFEDSSSFEERMPSPALVHSNTLHPDLRARLQSIEEPNYRISEQADQTIVTVADQENTLVSIRDTGRQIEDQAHLQGLAPVDLLFDRTRSTKPWSFSNRRLRPEYPSHVFQSFSRYSGTQQSDRQIYNVDVTILTVDVAQCAMTGFLLIRGLTPEHDTLQTYFTGEIIGGPPQTSDEGQYHTFRTANPAWGASEKTDLTHWARFPAWRSLSSHAKRDINFTYPTDGGNWWEQENVFMRWKEHFLVPDHKTKSIAGASFEGFYYICLNQVQGRISGIYYHSKSEKYQQLELKHEGQPDIFNRGVTPCVEFR